MNKEHDKKDKLNSDLKQIIDEHSFVSVQELFTTLDGGSGRGCPDGYYKDPVTGECLPKNTP